MLRMNSTKAKLKEGKAVLGCFLRYANANLVELLAYQGWDFLIFDAEHGAIEPNSCEHMIRAAELHDVTPIVRVTTNSPPVILRFLDTGAMGVQVPSVSSASEAVAAVRAAKYYPQGNRGLASVRAAKYGQKEPLSEYVSHANAETMVVVQVETSSALTCLPEIAAVDGVDVIFIGPTDLSQALGYPGQTHHPVVNAALEHIVDTVRKSNTSLGIWVADAESALKWRDRGASYIATSLEFLLSKASRSFLNGLGKGTR